MIPLKIDVWIWLLVYEQYTFDQFYILFSVIPEFKQMKGWTERDVHAQRVKGIGNAYHIFHV